MAKKRLFYLSGSFIMILLIALTIFLIAIVSKSSSNPKAETPDKYIITIHKTPTVTVYVSGDGVDKTESVATTDIYEVTKGSTVSFRAVNESKIFTGWKFTPAVNDIDLTSSYIVFTPTSDLTVELLRRDPVKSDYGSYIQDGFIIDKTITLVQLQKMFTAGTSIEKMDNEIIECYNSFFAEDESYQIASQENIKSAIRDIYFNKIQNGYYIVSSPFMVFEDNYYGIGNEAYPFKGVMCGQRKDNISNIFVTTNCDGVNGNNYSGLFGVLEEEAVVRNLNVNTSISFTYGSEKNIDNIYAGGLAGIIRGGHLYNLNISTQSSMNGLTNEGIYIGGLAGKIEGGIKSKSFGLDTDNQVTCKLNNAVWIVANKSLSSKIYLGGIAGFAKNMYIKSANIDISNFQASVTSDFRDTRTDDEYKENANAYIGNVFGYYENNMILEIENVNVIGSAPEELSAVVSSGNAYVAGGIGYVASSANLQLGRIKFNIPTGENVISAESLSRLSSANLYAGGLIGKIADDSNQYIIANEEFKNGIEEIEVDNEIKKSYNAIFDANFTIRAIQRGKSNGTTFGKTIAGGLVGYGYINANGTSDTPSNIVVSLDKFNFIVNAVQDTTATTTTSTTVANDKEHCIAGLVYGLFGTNTANKNIKIENINYYISSATAKATRNLGSTAGGDLHTGGLVGYAYDVSLENIQLLIDQSYVLSEGYSYELTWSDYTTSSDANNVYTGGLVGEFTGSTSTTDLTMKNVSLAGWDYVNHKMTATSLKIISIQNSSTSKVDYSNENYCGGIIGRLFKADVDGAHYMGDSQSYVYMQSNENPDTAFCGGIVGYIKNDIDGNSINVRNCLVENATIRGVSTCVLPYSEDNVNGIRNPDMYIGGIVGGCFHDSKWAHLVIDNCRVYESTIESNGNEREIVYAGGIIGIVTWSGTADITNCYVYRSFISANLYRTNVTASDSAVYAAGIMGESKARTNIKYCASIDTEISSLYDDNNTDITGIVASGIASIANSNESYITNCYSNSSLRAIAKDSSKAQCYGIAPSSFNPNDSSKNPNVSSSYYVEDRAGVNNRYNNFINISVAERLVNSSDGIDGDRIFPNFSDEHTTSIKFYPIAMDDKFKINNLDVTNKRVTLAIKQEYQNATDTLRVWVNIKENGDTKNPTEYANDFERHEAGWFLFGRFLIKTGTPEINNENRIQIDQISYPIDDKEYICDDETNKTFVNINYPYDTSSYIGYEQDTTSGGTHTINNVDSEGNPVTEVKDIIGHINVLVHDNIPQLKLVLRVKAVQGKWDSHYLAFFDENGDRFYPFAQNVEYGRYTYNKSYDGDDEIYEWLFTPNKNLSSNKHFYIGWIIGTSENYKYSKNVIDVHLTANTFELVGFQYADYTLPINYFDDNIGTEENPWLLKKNSIIKIIPVFTKTNDRDLDKTKPLYISEQGITFVNYSIDKQQLTDAKMNSNGELECGDRASQPGEKNSSVTITLKNSPENSDKTSVTVYFRVSDVYDVTYSSLGANVDGLLFAYNNADYSLNMDINFGYCGRPLKGTDVSYVTIGSTKYSMDALIQKGWIKDENLNIVTNFEIDTKKYILTIPADKITDNIDIHFEFEKAYVITFDAQTQSFNDSTLDTHIRTYLIPQGTTFKTYFTQTIKDELEQWTSEKGIFGYVFMGYYLIDTASSIPSYGISFDSILEMNVEINTTYTFYARWSFLIEVIEAPGTHVKTSFSSDFLEKYGVDATGNELSQSELEQLGIKRAITIPINNNKGYVFTIEKDKEFIGEVDVQVFICTKESGKKVLTKIDIEKYYENMYLYHIPSELITGYLIIATSVSNSELIVGENTSQIMDNILPEDGVYTFKYIANHYNTPDSKSYIYNSGVAGKANYNLELNRDMILRFYQETYDVATNQIKLVEKPLVKNTIIEVYYHQYINGEYQPSEDIVGTYFVNDNNITEVVLSDFKKLNGDETAFPSITFENLLNGHKTLSEVFYFVITPPNGYTEHTEEQFGTVSNRYIYAGYYDANKKGTDDPFVKGVRTQHDLVNIPIEDEINGFVIDETSCHIRKYSVVPSRITQLEHIDNQDNQFLFKDLTDYHIFDLTIKRGNILNGILVFKAHSFNEDENTYVESSFIDDGIKDLTLSIGYNYGEVKIYAKASEDDPWELVEAIQADSYDYKDYKVNFDVTKNYKYFQIHNKSEQEIRINKLSFSTITNGMTYEFTQEDILNMVITGKDEDRLRIIHVNSFNLLVNHVDISLDGIISLKNETSYTESSIIEDKIKSLSISIGGANSGEVEIFGKREIKNEEGIVIGWGDWESIQTISINSMDYTEYAIDFDVTKDYKYFQIKNNSNQEISINKLSYTTIEKGHTYEFNSENISNMYFSDIIHLRKTVEGDTRHEGKHFVMAVQFKDKTNHTIIENLEGVTITINGTTTLEQPDHGKGEVTFYYDLTNIINQLATNQITIEINCPEGYLISCVELLEAVSIQKPAMSEVRDAYIPTNVTA